MPYDTPAFERLVEDREGQQDPSDLRSIFARDRDRILYSTSFLRMAGKAQVVPVGELGLYHTRLTHSLKVAQLGRRLAERIRDKHGGEQLSRNSLLRPPDPDLVEAGCLAHDLGHAPFGHVGERVLCELLDKSSGIELQSGLGRLGRYFRDERRALMRRGGFEGNAQTFRILAYLSARRPLAPRCGLNLTRATLDATIKYPRLRVHGRSVQEKWGAFNVDAERLEWVREGRVGPQARLSFEAQLMDWCDDVTYAVHDMIDFYRSGFIPLDRLFQLRGRRPHYRPSEEATVFLGGVVREQGFDYGAAEEAWKSLTPLVEVFEPWRPVREIKAATQRVTSQLITYLVEGVAFTGDEPCRHDGDLAIHDNEDEAAKRRLAAELLKGLLWRYVIRSPELASQQQGQARIVRELFTIYQASPDMLPEDRREDLEDHGDHLRAAADHVASLTEEGAHGLYQRLTGYRLGAITDVLTP